MQCAEAVVSGQGFITDVRSENLGESYESEEEIHGFGGEGNHWCSFMKETGWDEERERWTKLEGREELVGGTHSGEDPVFM